MSIKTAFFTTLGAWIIIFALVIFHDGFADYTQKLLGMANKKETLTFLGLGVSGLIALLGLVALNKRADAQIKLNQLTEKGLSQDRLKAAVEHLASREESARIASFYEFFYLARDERDYAQNILGILCAHLRHISNAMPESPDQEKPTEEVKTLVSVLFSKEAQGIFSGLDYDLQRANLTKANFRNMHRPTGQVDFRHANLSEADFYKADVSRFVFDYAILYKTSFLEATMHKVRMFNVKLKDTIFYEAKMQEAILCSMELEPSESDNFFTSFAGTELQNALICSENLKNAHWARADFDNVALSGSELQGVDLSRVKNLETADLSGTDFDDNTIFPEGFSIPSGMTKVPFEGSNE